MLLEIFKTSKSEGQFGGRGGCLKYNVMMSVSFGLQFIECFNCVNIFL